MSTTRVSEAVARPVRTAVQMTPAAVFTEVIDVFIYDMDERGYLAAFALLTLVIGFVQNLAENRAGWALLRNVPPVEAPVVDSHEDDDLAVADAPALDNGVENADVLVGEEVDPEHDLDVDAFEEER